MLGRRWASVKTGAFRFSGQDLHTRLTGGCDLRLPQSYQSQSCFELMALLFRLNFSEPFKVKDEVIFARFEPKT
jgi:type II secretory pathway component PulK